MLWFLNIFTITIITLNVFSEIRRLLLCHIAVFLFFHVCSFFCRNICFSDCTFVTFFVFGKSHLTFKVRVVTLIRPPSNLVELGLKHFVSPNLHVFFATLATFFPSRTLIMILFVTVRILNGPKFHSADMHFADIAFQPDLESFHATNEQKTIFHKIRW